MIIWLGLTELSWIGYWLLAGGGKAPTPTVYLIDKLKEQSSE